MRELVIEAAYPDCTDPELVIIHTMDGETYSITKKEIQRLLKL